MDHDEHLTAAAIRETKEEAGIDINLTGVLSIHYSPHPNYHSPKSNSGHLKGVLYMLPCRELCPFVYHICCFTKG